MATEPIIKLDPEGRATLLLYQVPEPTSYSGKNLIELDFDEEFFLPELRTPPATETPPSSHDPDAIRTSVLNGMRNGFADRKLFSSAQVESGTLRWVEKTQGTLEVRTTRPVTEALRELDPDELASRMFAGQRLNIRRTLYGTLTHSFIPEPKEAQPRLYIVETYRLTSFLGSYGAGRTLHTLTLAPGEKTKISIKTYTKRTEDRKQASSILDSFSQESSDEFETSLQTEHSNKSEFTKSFEYYADVEAEASWGWGSASVKAGVKGSTNSAREEFSKNVSNSLQKHASKASAKRDVQINTSYEVKEESGEETSVKRRG